MISSASNPTIKRVRALAAPAPQHRRAAREFVVEGIRAVEEALDGGARPALVLYEPRALERTPRGARLLSRVARLAEAQEVSATALAAATETVQPQGVVAVFPWPVWPEAAPEGVPLVLVLDGIRDPGNLGTILRSAEAAGVTACRLTPDCVDLFNPKVVRAGAGVHFRLPCYPDEDWPAITAALDARGVAARAALDAQGAAAYYAWDWRRPAALIVGNEAHGLSAGARAAATALLAIPMQGGTESLNAAMAGSIVLFEARRQRSTAGSGLGGPAERA